MSKESDLLQRARRFDLDALAEIYDQYSPELYRYAIRLMSDPEQAEDCVAETFSRFLDALQGGGGPSQYLRAYLYRVAHNWVTDQYRRQPPPPLPLDTRLIADWQHNPAVVAGENIHKETVLDALKLLTPDQRQVIILKYIEDLSNEEVAEALGKPVGAVKSLQHRALAALRRLLVEEHS